MSRTLQTNGVEAGTRTKREADRERLAVWVRSLFDLLMFFNWSL